MGFALLGATLMLLTVLEIIYMYLMIYLHLSLNNTVVNTA